MAESSAGLHHQHYRQHCRDCFVRGVFMASSLALLVVWFGVDWARVLLFYFSNPTCAREIHRAGAGARFAAAVGGGSSFLPDRLQRFPGPARVAADLVAVQPD